MSPIYTYENKPLLVDGKLASDPACCCGGANTCNFCYKLDFVWQIRCNGNLISHSGTLEIFQETIACAYGFSSGGVWDGNYTINFGNCIVGGSAHSQNITFLPSVNDGSLGIFIIMQIGTSNQIAYDSKFTFETLVCGPDIGGFTESYSITKNTQTVSITGNLTQTSEGECLCN